MIAPFVIGTVALYNWVISPHVGYLHAMQRLEPVLSTMAEAASRVSGTLGEKHASLRALQRELAESQSGLFPYEESKLFIHDLQDLVETAGCTVMAVDVTDGREAPAAPDPNAPVAARSLRLDVTAAGQQEQVVALLQSLRQRRPKVWVASCRLELRDPDGGRLEVRLGLALDAATPPDSTHPSKENDHVGTVQKQEEDGSSEDPDRGR